MRPIVRSCFAVLVFLIACSPAAAIWGTPDQVPAATLLAPLLEAGVNVTTHPHDTLTAVYTRSGTLTVHWIIWTIDGVPAISGNREIAPAATWGQSFRNALSQATPEERALLVDGDFYRGFMTVDVVTAPTDETPFSPTYPFAHTNGLMGATYFVRLLEGSANGLAMVPIEAVEPSANAFLAGYYTGSTTGLREEIDGNARDCIRLMGQGATCSAGTVNPNGGIHRIRARVWRNSGPLDVTSRLIVFAWNTARPGSGGPSAVCDLLGCNADYVLTRTREDGTILAPQPVRLDHVVNVLDITGSDGVGEVLLGPIVDPDDSTQVFGFVFNSAQPEGTGQNWDAVFEANIQVTAD